MNGLRAALDVLTAMLTPAVLILASGSLIAATATRLGRVVDRARQLADCIEELGRTAAGAKQRAAPEQPQERLSHLQDQLESTSRRARLLQRSMTSLYLALSLFLATSMAIGIDAASGQEYARFLIFLGIFGIAFLFYSSILLISESRIALRAIDRELDFARRISLRLAPYNRSAASARLLRQLQRLRRRTRAGALGRTEET